MKCPNCSNRYIDIEKTGIEGFWVLICKVCLYAWIYKWKGGEDAETI